MYQWYLIERASIRVCGTKFEDGSQQQSTQAWLSTDGARPMLLLLQPDPPMVHHPLVTAHNVFLFPLLPRPLMAHVQLAPPPPTLTWVRIISASAKRQRT